MTRTAPRRAAAAHPFQALYRRHYGFVWHVVRRFGVMPPHTDDAVQDTFVTAYRRFDEIAMPSAKAWLYGVARRIASNYRRADHRSARKRSALAVAVHEPDAPRPELLLLLDRFLDGLAGEDRELFVLTELEGMSGPEAARALDLNLSTTYSRIQTLRRRFRDSIADTDPRRIVRAARGDRPRATAHGWAALSAQVGLATATTAAPVVVGGLLIKVVALAVPVVVAIGVVGVMSRPAPDEPVAHASAPTRDATSPTAASRPATEPSTTAPAELAVTAPASEPTAAPVAANVSVRARPRTRAGEPVVSASLARHNQLLVDAANEVRDGAADEALAIIAEHALEFPQSPLADARTALWIEALCATDRTAQARGEARMFLRAHPGSMVRGRIERSCVGAVVDSGDDGQPQDR